MSWIAIFARLAYVTFVCLPVILLDEWLRNRRMKRRRKRGG